MPDVGCVPDKTIRKAPKAHFVYIWLRMVIIACWTMLSSSEAMPRGRCRPSACGIYTLHEAYAQYAPLHFSYSPYPDGRRFLMINKPNRPALGPTNGVMVMTNWQKLAPEP